MGILSGLGMSEGPKRRGRRLPKIPKGLAKRARKALADAAWKKKVAERKAEIKRLQTIANKAR